MSTSHVITYQYEFTIGMRFERERQEIKQHLIIKFVGNLWASIDCSLKLKTRQTNGLEPRAYRPSALDKIGRHRGNQ